MRWIPKGREPASLREYRAVPGATYDGAGFSAVKDDLRAALLRDQAWLCCYCMRRISADERPHPSNPQAPSQPQMKVEHWRPQARFPALALGLDEPARRLPPAALGSRPPSRPATPARARTTSSSTRASPRISRRCAARRGADSNRPMGSSRRTSMTGSGSITGCWSPNAAR